MARFMLLNFIVIKSLTCSIVRLTLVAIGMLRSSETFYSVVCMAFLCCVSMFVNLVWLRAFAVVSASVVYVGLLTDSP